MIYTSFTISSQKGTCLWVCYEQAPNNPRRNSKSIKKNISGMLFSKTPFTQHLNRLCKIQSVIPTG